MTELQGARTFPRCRYAAARILLMICLACLIGSAGATLYTAADCNCGGIGLPLDGSWPIEAPEDGYYALTCQYGGYSNIPYAGKGRGVEFVIHKEKPDIARSEFQGRAAAFPQTVPKSPNILEFDHNDPNRAVYSSKKQVGSKMMYDGTHVLVYKNNNYIFVSGLGYDVGDGQFLSMLSAAESCAKAAADAKQPKTPTTPPTTPPTKTPTTPPTTTPVTPPITEPPTLVPTTTVPPTTKPVIELPITKTTTPTTPPSTPPTTTPTVTPTPDPADCKEFNLKPGEFDMAYSKDQLRSELLNAMSEYARKGELKGASGKYSRMDPTQWTRYEMFLFTDDLEKMRTDSWYSGFFTGQENALGERIVARNQKQGRKLGPGEVLQESLELNDGNVFDSLLTAHNYLKGETNRVRRRQQDARELRTTDLARVSQIESILTAEGYLKDGVIFYPQSGMFDRYKALIQERDNKLAAIEKQNKIIEDNGIYDTQLLPMRTRSENGGVWYHLYVTTSMAYAERMMTWSSPASDNVVLEHRVYKDYLSNLFRNAGSLWNDQTLSGRKGIDNTKYCTDMWGIEIGGDIYRFVPENREAQRRLVEKNPYFWNPGTWNLNNMRNGYSGREL